MEIQLRDYQVAAVDGTSAEWRKGNKHVLIVLPTGAGKTTVACEIVKRAVGNGKRVLFLAHRRRLIQQISERMGEFGIPYTVEMASLDDEQAWVRRDWSAPVTVASRDTLLSRAMRNGWTGLPSADLLITDEAHRLESEQYRGMANACNIQYWIGLTATACRPDGSGLGRKNWQAIVETATVNDLMASGSLVQRLRIFRGEMTAEKRRRGTPTGIAGDAIATWMRHAEGHRTIGFTTTVAEAVAVRDRFRQAGVPAEVIESATPDSEREDIIGRIKDGKVLWVGNVGTMVEGVDIPELTVCQILCKCESFIRYWQAVGRVLRPAPWIGKEWAMLLDHSGAIVHGIPGLDTVEWSIDEDDDLHARIKKDKEDGKRANPVVCLQCGCLFAGTPACPECGAVPPRREKKKDRQTESELLTEMQLNNPVQYSYRQLREWQQILRICAAKGWNGRRAGAMFKAKFGEYPERTDVQPTWSFEHSHLPVAELCPHLLRKKAGVS